MKSRLKGLLSLAALSLAGLLLSTGAQAQGLTFTGPTEAYGLLNGEFLALYLNERGDLGAPRQGLAKPAGPLDSTGHPTGVANDGSVTSGTYGALFSSTSTIGAGAGTVGDSVGAKREYITGFSSNAEGYAIRIGDGSWMPYTGFTPVPGAFTTTGAINSQLTANSALTTGVPGLVLRQSVTFNTNNNLNRAKFTVTFDNTAGTSAITNLRYARVVNPNPGLPQGSNITTQSYLRDLFPGAFLINATNANLNLGIGVFPTDPNTHGTALVATPNEFLEGDLLNRGNLDTNVDLLDPFSPNPLEPGTAPNFNYVMLHTGDNGADFVDTAGNVVNSTTDFGTDFQGTDFRNQVAFSSQAAETGLVLYSPLIDVPAGGTSTFTFYYFFDQFTPSQVAVPEPGTVSLFLGGLVSGSLLLRRRKKQA
ncbi:MAG TPA: PEP-CTERM sorting domain-containing protein [Chthonomonadaceae bacterium]|nr:PEP-CTERM sorting domain-containing protein [Chthonomonadaceae bacterium]